MGMCRPGQQRRACYRLVGEGQGDGGLGSRWACSSVVPPNYIGVKLQLARAEDRSIANIQVVEEVGAFTFLRFELGRHQGLLRYRSPRRAVLTLSPQPLSQIQWAVWEFNAIQLCFVLALSGDGARYARTEGRGRRTSVRATVPPGASVAGAETTLSPVEVVVRTEWGSGYVSA